jgi:glycosyltransferase involved in cell wall biosynthesis
VRCLSSSGERKIGLIGRVGDGAELFDGQTVKTRNMLRLLQEQYGEEAVLVVDTLDWRQRVPQIIAGTRRCLRECRDVVILLSTNGRRVLFPILARSARRRGTRVYQNLIGGCLASNLEKYPQWVGYLNAFKVNWVESHKLVDDLAAKGVINAKYLPNFKHLDLPKILEERAYGDGWRFCTFSRVMEQKGISDAMRAVEGLNGGDGRTYSLDVYGPVDGGYKAELDALLRECPHCTYRGSVPASESVGTVAGYDALLFPTKWRLEGIPGTIIDALTAGVPVIGAKWQYYGEMLEDGATGYGYELGRNDLLPDAIRRFVGLTDEERNVMRRACLERAKAYTPEAVAGEIRREIGR